MMAKVTGVELGGVRGALGPLLALLGIIIITTLISADLANRRERASKLETQKRIDFETAAWQRACAPHRAIFRGGDWWCRDKDHGTLFLPEFLQ